MRAWERPTLAERAEPDVEVQRQKTRVHSGVQLIRDSDGEVAEWFKAAVLKTVERKFRGFESYLLRHYQI